MQKFKFLLGSLSLVMIIGLNVRHTFNDYGVKSNRNLQMEITAQTTTDDTSGSTTGGGTTGDKKGEKSCPHDMSKYDLTVYTIHHMEDYKKSTTTITLIDAQGSAGIDIGSGKFNLKDLVNIGLNANLRSGVKIEVDQPYCADSDCNICKKDHIEKKPKFLGVKVGT